MHHCFAFVEYFLADASMHVYVYVHIPFNDAAMRTFSVVCPAITKPGKAEVLHRSPGKSSCRFYMSSRGNALVWLTTFDI